MPKYVYARGQKLWCRLKDESGKWISRPTPYRVGDEKLAARYVEAAQKALDARRAVGANSGPLTVKAYAATWIKDRRERGIRSAGDEEARLMKFALPSLGAMRLTEVTSEHVRDLVRDLRTKAIAPRTVLHVYSALHSLFEDAVVESSTTEVSVNPVKVKRGVLPEKADKDPEWREAATYTVSEVERLISDPAIPPERRVQYALKAIAGLRHGEVAALRWRHYDAAAEPLGKLIIAAAFNSRHRELKTTKTSVTRRVPVHSTLASILSAWKISHWQQIYGRPPADDDLIVPTRNLTPVNATDAARAFTADLRTLGMRVEAGSLRSRGGHDLRAWFKTRTVEDGADSDLIRRLTHARPKDVEGGYDRFSWATYCRELGKLSVRTLGAEPLALATAPLQARPNVRHYKRKEATPTGFEPVSPA